MRSTEPNKLHGRLEVIGLHLYPVSEEPCREAMALKCPLPEMSDDEALHAEEHLSDGLSALCVVEVLVEDPTATFGLGDVHQPSSDMDAADLQVPYDEVTLPAGEGLARRLTSRRL